MNIGYEFENKRLLEIALTHISYANDNGIESNQRLEFLGDSVLSFVVAERIYKHFPNCDEGKLTKIRASLVCEKTLAELATEMDLGSGIRFGKSESHSGGDRKRSILADTYEAVLGAIFLDSGIENAKKWVFDTFGGRLENISVINERDYKSELQIYFQKRDKNTSVVEYVLKSKTGPDHSPTFTVYAVYEGRKIGEGSGGNRKSADRAAAKAAFEKLVQKR